MGLVTLVEDIAAQEKRLRVLAEADSRQARRASNAIRSALQQQAVVDTLARVHRDEEAAHCRVARTGGQSISALVNRIRRTIGL